MSSEFSLASSSALGRSRRKIQELLSKESFGIIVDGALDRRQIEKLIARLSRGHHGSLRELPRKGLVSQLVDAFWVRDDAAYLLIKELDRATRPQASIVRSIEPSKADKRLDGDYVVRPRRHGARILWSLIRDARPAMRSRVKVVLERYLEESRRIERIRNEIVKHGGEVHLEALDRVHRDSAQRVMRLEAEISVVERDRADLLAEVGRRKAALKAEAQRREALQRELESLRKLVVAPQTQPLPGKTASEDGTEASLWDRLGALEQENEQLRSHIVRMRCVHDALGTLRPTLPNDAASRSGHVVEAPKRQRAKRGEGTVRVGLFVDVANISGAARRFGNRPVDYRQLLVEVVGKRHLVVARAYAIDKGGGFAAFARALKQAGFKVAAKKPKRFADGTVKADWDIGMAIDMLTQHQHLDVLVLGSGDGDFVPLVSELRKRGVRVEGVGFQERSADELVRAVDHFIELDESVLES